MNKTDFSNLIQNYKLFVSQYHANFINCFRDSISNKIKINNIKRKLSGDN